ncbi:HAD family hydrolase [Gluconobacter kondonii]|uniref:HAD family hydrolase n=1 Tax=Gluconobacter kondonii TaxID=941463 RepID=UPI001B8BCDFB|nr:HAD family phosphatase [Gluconobacter kondonii]MBS1055142.1 HAD family phosphatase [Gluconobacter kondonii]MBS1066935.1 HAD family phosphatase [Gluconobacter kondonii]MBS1081849.1 HAD family phosphatase [Gluconobacter kondonii]MBS1084589.1 HAD family phosphatase [Gluconobacter kondonii]
MKNKNIDLVIFDCDGVLVGGESLSTELMANEARKYGWNITNAQADKIFSGGELKKIGELIAEKSGSKIPDDWAVMMERKIAEMMRTQAVTVDGAEDMLQDIIALDLPIRVGSNSSTCEMDAKFSKTGLDQIIQKDRIHSARDLNIPKPNPDIYLHAAQEEGVPPEACIVLEDSDAGVEAAVRAGMTCVLLRDAEKPDPKFGDVIRIDHLSQFAGVVQSIASNL